MAIRKIPVILEIETINNLFNVNDFIEIYYLKKTLSGEIIKTEKNKIWINVDDKSIEFLNGLRMG